MEGPLGADSVFITWGRSLSARMGLDRGYHCSLVTIREKEFPFEIFGDVLPVH